MGNYATLNKIDREQLEQIAKSGAVWAGDLISKQAAHRLISWGLVQRDEKGKHRLAEAGVVASEMLGYIEARSDRRNSMP